MCGIPWPPHGLLARRVGTPKMPGYRDVISNGPFSIAIADTDKRGEGAKNSQLSSVSVCASNDFRKCDLLSQAGV